MRILVTGCAGFIGARVVEMLLERGDEVVGIDDLSSPTNRLARIQGTQGFHFHQLNGTAGAHMTSLCMILANQHADAVIHLAAKAGVRQSIKHPTEYMRVNALSTVILLEMCREYNIPKFVLASTSSLYGITAGTPSRETDATTPLSPYAASKAAAEAICQSYHHLHGIDVSILRYFTVYGPDGRPDMFIYRACEAAVNGTPLTIYGEGTQARDYTYVDDIAHGTIAALKPVGCEVINLAAGNSMTLHEAVRRLNALSGEPIPIKIHHEEGAMADVPPTWGDNSKAAKLLGWHPSVTIRAGLEKTLAWHREQLTHS